MSVLLLTNPYASQPQPPTGGSAAMALSAAGPLSVQAVAPAQSSAESRGSGTSTSYDGMGAGAGGAAARQSMKQSEPPPRPIDATPRSIVTAQAESAAHTRDAGAASPPQEQAEIVDMAEHTRQRAQEMALPLPTLPFLLPA